MMLSTTPLPPVAKRVLRTMRGAIDPDTVHFQSLRALYRRGLVEGDGNGFLKLTAKGRTIRAELEDVRG